MAKQTILKLEHGDIELSDDGETKIYTYRGTPMSELSEDQKQEIRDSKQMQELVKSINEVAEQLAIAFETVAKVALPILNRVAEQINKAHAEIEAAKKVKKDEAK